MRLIKIFLLTLQEVFEQRARSFVWFVLACVNPLIMILFWRGAHVSSSTFSIISSYFLFLMIGASILMSHSEESIAFLDIAQGRLSMYLLKPINYFIFKWLAELPYRALQGSFGVAAIAIVVFLYHIHLTTVPLSFINIFLVMCIIIAAMILAQVFKMCLGFICFWTTDAYGIFQFAEMLLFIFAGYIVPVSFYPHGIAVISYLLPFSYMIYFPVAAVTGFFTTLQLIWILLGQIVWIVLMSIIYNRLWTMGVKIFTGVGQ